MAAARHPMKTLHKDIAELRFQTGVPVMLLYRCEHKPSENVSVLSGQGRRRCAANINSGKMARGVERRVITERRHVRVV